MKGWEDAEGNEVTSLEPTEHIDLYAIWEINTYTVTVKKVVDGDTATDDQFVKFVNEGETLIIPVMPEENADLTQEYKMFAKFGVAVVFADKGAAVYELA